MIRVVLDSNVFISALLFGGNPRRVISLAEYNLIELYTSETLRNEVERVLTVKFQWSQKRAFGVTAYLWSICRSVEPRQNLTDCIDPEDNRVLECAVEAGARSIVTGDQHLLKLDPYRGIAIVSPREFLDSGVWRREP